MSTRFYFPITGSPPGPSPANASGWGVVTPPGTRRPLVLAKSNTSIGNQVSNAEAVTTSPINVYGARQWISDPLTAQTISGTFSGVVRLLESSAAADMSLQIIIRVCNSADAIVATLYAGHTAALNTTPGALGEEVSTTSSTRIFNAVPITPYTCANGDRIVIEWGVRASNIVATSYTATFRWGDPTATADFALTSGLTTDLCPWLEFSADLFNVQQEARIEAVNLEAVTKGSTPEHRATAVNLESVLRMSKPEHRVAAVNLEAVLVRRLRPDQHEFWGQVEY